MKRGSFTLSTIMCAALVAGCSAKTPAASSTLQVAASFYPLAYLAEQIGGDHVTVTQITPGGVEPHDYDPSPEQLAAVFDAKVFLMNGAGVDAWADKVEPELTQKGKMTLVMTKKIPVLTGFDEEGEADPTKPANQNAGIVDPHVWLNPVNMQQEATLISDAFIAADPDNADAYSSNAAALTKKLKDLDAAYISGLKNCTVHAAVVSHNAFRYMAKQYGFETLAIAGLSPDEEPSSKRIAELADFAKKNDVRVIFFESLVSPKLSETVANEIGAQSLVLNPIEGLTSDEAVKNEDYIRIMKLNLQNLRTALQCQ